MDTPAAGQVFPRVFGRRLPFAVRAAGATIWDADGRAYLDAAGGAVVVGIGHGRAEVAAAMAAQTGRLAYAHGTTFTTEALEAYAAEVGAMLPLDGPAIYPVSGGSEAIETALKMARAYHLARDEPGRDVVIARWGSYHGNSLGALDLSGREPLRRPYAPWLTLQHVSAYPYRAGQAAAHALGDPAALAAELEAVIEAAGDRRVAAFVAEPIVGATLGAVAPPDGYWRAIADVCRRHGVLLIADEVMTGFGRTGRWFGSDHWGLRPDILVAAKGATSGYWPFGFAAASGPVYEAIAAGGFVHGFTFSHSAVGAAVAREVLRILREEELVAASAAKGGASRCSGRPRRSSTSARSAGAGSWSAWSSWWIGRPRRPSRGRSGAWRRSWRPRASGACSSTRGREPRTASTATRCCWGRRSWSRTTSWSGSPTAWGRRSRPRRRRRREGASSLGESARAAPAGARERHYPWRNPRRSTATPIRTRTTGTIRSPSVGKPGIVAPRTPHPP
jgi:adenosylmethionine-8-amino-7-oxononanoate aminotransferase